MDYENMPAGESLLSDLMHGDVTGDVLGAAFEVHSQLGPGFLEKIYEEALAHELELRGIRYDRQVKVPVYYKSKRVGKHRLDFVVEGKVVVELKSVRELTNTHIATVLSYLAATQLSVALLLNFNKASLEYKRISR